MKRTRVNYTKQTWMKVTDLNKEVDFTLGPINSESFLNDPKHLIFTLSRYKFCAKMLKDYCKNIIEIGCGEGIGSIVLLRETSAVITAIDFDKAEIKYARDNITRFFDNKIKFLCCDMVYNPYKGKKAEGLVCIDVIEHIHPSEEKKFFYNSISLLKKNGIAIFGTPNSQANIYSSDRSKIGHINLFDAQRLQKVLGLYFNKVFIFSMNDEVVHTGFDKLAHYFLALCIK